MFLDTLVRRLWNVDERVSSFGEIDIDNLYHKLGIKVLVIDVDGTLTAYHEIKIIEEYIKLIKHAKTLEMAVGLLSNCTQEREFELRQYLIRYFDFIIGKARKPFSGRLRNLMDEYDVEPSQVAVIGDQYFADIMLGNWVGTYTIKVDDQELIKTEPREKQIQRRVEEFIYGMIFERYERIS